MTLDKMGAFTFDHTNQQDDLYKGMSAAEIKVAFDSRGNELKEALNTLIDALQATTGAGEIGVSAIPGLTGTNIQSLIESLKTLVDSKSNSTDVYTKSALLSTTIDVSGADLIKSSEIVGVPGKFTIREILQELKYQINSAVTGTIPNASIGPEKLTFNPATKEELNAIQLVDTKVSITDANNHFTASKLDGVLEELFTSADSIKTNVSGAVGLPATANDTGAQLASIITTEKERLAAEIGDGSSANTLKYLADRLIVRSDEIATAVNGKGVPATFADTLAQLATKIGQISLGKKTAEGTTSSNSSGRLIVSGLGFKPRLIVASAAAGGANVKSILFTPDAGNLGANFYTSGTNPYAANPTDSSVTASGFNLNTGLPNNSYAWIAVE